MYFATKQLPNRVDGEYHIRSEGSSYQYMTRYRTLEGVVCSTQKHMIDKQFRIWLTSDEVAAVTSDFGFHLTFLSNRFPDQWVLDRWRVAMIAKQESGVRRHSNPSSRAWDFSCSSDGNVHGLAQCYWAKQWFGKELDGARIEDSAERVRGFASTGILSAASGNLLPGTSVGLKPAPPTVGLVGTK